MNLNRCYSKLITLNSFEERFNYLKLDGKVGAITFGSKRYLNQILYTSDIWKSFRREIIIRDCGNDLACFGYEISGLIIVHHIDPITIDDVINRNPKVFDPENVVTTRLSTHNAIHYGDESILIKLPVERKPNDTIPWRK